MMKTVISLSVAQTARPLLDKWAGILSKLPNKYMVKDIKIMGGKGPTGYISFTAFSVKFRLTVDSQVANPLAIRRGSTYDMFKTVTDLKHILNAYQN